jgi:hypothetical protein
VDAVAGFEGFESGVLILSVLLQPGNLATLVADLAALLA